MNIKTLLVTLSLATALSGIPHTDGDTIERQISPVPVKSAAATDSIDSNPVQTESQLTMMADSAYTADNYILAEALYCEAISRFGTSSTLFYNLGNAYYRQGNLGKAIVNYERALKLDPTNADASANLEFVKGKIADRQLDESSILDRLWGNLVTGLKADTWAWVSIILFALFLAGALTYLFSSVVIVKKVSFFGGIIVFVVCALSIVISFAAANRATTDRYAVVLPPSAQLSTTPREARNQSEEAFLLHEGTKVEIVDSVTSNVDGKWYEVLVGPGKRAWIKATDVERI
ncbi:MAG: tetratricopeptide repeat protein [bacterium]|nr:tetratricopeptide repeat protein [bacterium]